MASRLVRMGFPGSDNGGGGISLKALFTKYGTPAVVYDGDLGRWQDSVGGVPGASGQPVGAWADQSGNGYTATGATTTRPVLTLDQLKSHDVVTWDSTPDDVLRADAVGAHLTGDNTAYTWAAVVKNASLAGTQSIWGCGNSANANGCQNWRFSGTAKATYYFRDDTGTLTTTNSAADVTNAFMIHVGVLTTDSKLTWWINNVKYFDAAAVASGAYTINTVTLGAQWRGSVDSSLNGAIAAFCIWPGNLSAQAGAIYTDLYSRFF